MARIYQRHIDEEIISGMRLGRHVRFDSRSLMYLYQAPAERVIEAKLWPRNIAILDQGELGSCTGNALTGALGTDPDYEGLPSGHPALDENEAVALYSAATQLDDYDGSYPPDDTGSDGISVCKAGQQAGLISGYQHCTDLATTEQALQDGPVIVGVNWYSSFDTPASDGTVSISKHAYVRGGHEFEVRGIDPASKMFFADNSWAADWGNKGSFQFSYDTMSRLLSEQGDCTVPVPAAVPAPTPTPTPTPDNDLLDELIALIKQDWTAVTQWLADHGL
jgi:hypothetical protein